MSESVGGHSAPSGLPSVGEISWGSHICQFYRTREDLVSTLVPYFATGLSNHERCVWVTSEPLPASAAREALRVVVPDLDERERRGEIEIIDHDQWYLRLGSAEAILEEWLGREQAARRDGYAGLRITGNTFWLEPEAYASFAEYEARVHAAFRGRRIVAVCSYSLERCAPDDVIEVLQNHGAALVRQAGRWATFHGATFTLAALESAAPASEEPGHVAQFYDDGCYPAASVADFLASGAERGAGFMLVATRAHVAAIEEALSERGFDLPSAIGAGWGHVLTIDDMPAESLEPARLSGGPPPEMLRDFDALRARHGRVRVYGELVDVLCQRGYAESALELERWWSAVAERGDAEVLCSYGHETFHDAEQPHQLFKDVCAVHGAVLPNSNDPADPLPPDRARLVARLEHSQRLFLHTRARAEHASEHIASLQRVTAALSEAAGVNDVAAVVSGVMAEAAGAVDAVLAVVCENQWLELVDAEGQRALLEDGDALAAACVTGRARYPASQRDDGAEACLPLRVGSRLLGALRFRFAAPPPLPAARRALVEDVAAQAALALDRALLFEAAYRDRERAEAANRAKDQFLAMLGHELRNPLSPIVTALELMRMQSSDTFARERGLIERQVRHMTRLVDDLLDVSRITRGKIDIRPLRVDLADVIGTAVETVSPLLEAREHTFTLQVEPNLVVEADAHRLSQALSNLLTNAAKYTPPRGHIELAARAQGKRVRVSVKDNGLGIEAPLLAQIFGLFVQGPRGLDRSDGGLGLGLPIVRTLVELHGGTVAAYSDGPGSGSEMVIDLPLAPAAVATVLPAGGPPPRSGRVCRRVLVVDDNRDAALALAEALRKLGHTVDVAFDGPSALALSATARPDVALLDIGLPVMDGYELGRRLASLLTPRPPALVALTGYGLESDHARSSTEHFAAHLVKPVDLARVAGLLADLGTPVDAT